MTQLEVPRAGCPHEPHSFYCAQMNSLWCSTCVDHLSRNVADSEILGSLSFDSIATVAELAKEQTGKLASTQSVLRRVLHRQADSLLDCAELAKKELDDYFSDVIETIHRVHRNLAHDVDLLVASRRDALLKVSACEELVTQLVSETMLTRHASPADVVQCAKTIVRDCDRFLAQCEIALLDLLPANQRGASYCGGSVQTAAPSSSVVQEGHVTRNSLLLKQLESPYRIIFKKDWCFFDLGTLSVRDTAGNDVRSLAANGGDHRSTSVTSDHGGNEKIARRVGSASVENYSVASKRLWKPYQGLGVKTQRAITTPDASTLLV